MKIIITQYFSVIQILREINLGDFRDSKTAVFSNISLQKVPNSLKSKFRGSKCDKMAGFTLVNFSKLISRKI